MNEQYWEQFLHIKTNGDQALFPTDISIHRYEQPHIAILNSYSIISNFKQMHMLLISAVERDA